MDFHLQVCQCTISRPPIFLYQSIIFLYPYVIYSFQAKLTMQQSIYYVLYSLIKMKVALVIMDFDLDLTKGITDLYI